MSQTENVPAPKRSKRIPKKEYSAFVNSLDMRTVWLVSAQFENLVEPRKPDDVTVAINVGSRWTYEAEELVAMSRYSVRLVSVESKDKADAEASSDAEVPESLVELDAVFAVAFGLANQPPDQFVEQFSSTSLQLILWPYLRQLLHDHLGRTN